MTQPTKIYLYRLGMRLACLLPRSLAIGLSQLLACWGFVLAKNARNVIKKNLQYCHQSKLWVKTLKTFLNYGIYYVDLFRILTLNKTALKKLVLRAQGIDNLDRALQNKKGVILITAHLGNWDLAGAYLTSLGYPLTAVVEDIPAMANLHNFLRTKTGMETVFTYEIKKMINALHQNRVLVLLGDRDLTNRGLVANFLAGKKKIPNGPSAFALKYQAPIVLGYFVLDNKHKKYQTSISEPIYPQKNQTNDELTQFIADQLSKYIKQYPTQWFVFQDEWLEQ
ncbi:MAG: hypothetical protein N2748_01775 [candidate division WOR-3 bacterium]|nr:hypothetical protein [candidate division WOR-3 bacterium]